MLWAEFLENVPPNTEENIEDLFVKTQYQYFPNEQVL
jgi:hypothetical protein